MGVRVVMDTTSYLPRDLVERAGIELVSLYLNWQGRTDREADLPDYDEFYAHLRQTKDLPTTSQPSVGDFLAVYDPIIEAGDDIVSLHLSGGISGTVRAAQQARDALVERGVDAGRVEVIDSETCCGGLGLCGLAAATAAHKGGTVADATAAARTLRADLMTWFAVDTLEFLRRGGRIGAAQAYLGTALKVKPILTLGKEIEPIEKVRTSGKAVARLIEHLQERKDHGDDRFAVQHSADPDRAGQLADAGREIYGNEPLFVSEIGPVIGTHAGPGLLGVAGISSKLLS